MILSFARCTCRSSKFPDVEVLQVLHDVDRPSLQNVSDRLSLHKFTLCINFSNVAFSKLYSFIQWLFFWNLVFWTTACRQCVIGPKFSLLCVTSALTISAVVFFDLKASYDIIFYNYIEKFDFL